jgi:MFS family permease
VAGRELSEHSPDISVSTHSRKAEVRLTKGRTQGVFYGWWIVIAAFLNLFFAVGIVFYGFPVFYPSLVESLGFSRAQLTQGFFHGFLFVGLPCGLLAGVLIDRIGARWVILVGAGLVGASLVLMARITKLWHYEALCILEVLGYVLAGPIANQVLVARWFKQRRGQAMGYAYLGLGLGGVVSPLLVNHLIARYGWRDALEIVGLLITGVLLPVGIWITKSTPAELGLLPEGADEASSVEARPNAAVIVGGVGEAVGSVNFWLILLGSTLVIGAIGAVIQHFVLFLKDQGYTATAAARFFTAVQVASLGGRVIVGYLADRFSKANTMALFYFLIGASILLLSMVHQPASVWMFVALFGFSMGADYMLIPLVTAECFGTPSLGKILALIIMGYSLGQWGAPMIAGKIFDARHSYDLAWKIMAASGILGAVAIYAMQHHSGKLRRPGKELL